MIWGILLLAFILRIISINQSLWLDEAINVLAARNQDFISFVSKYPIGDFHPPGYFALLWIWSHVFGFGEIAVRLPSVLFGVATVAFIYLLGKELFDNKVALLAALLLAMSPLHVYYSQEARMYSMAAFSVIASMYFLICLEKGTKWSRFGYIISMVFVFYSDYVTYLILPAQLIYLVISKSDIWRRWVLSLAVAVLVLVPWFTIFPQQFIVGTKASIDLPGWRAVAGGTNLKNIALIFIKTVFGRITFDNKLIYGFLSVFCAVLYGLLIFIGSKKINQVKLLLCWLLIPIILAIIISPFVPVLSYFRMIFILPAFYLLVARGMITLPKIWLKYALGILVVISMVSLGIYYLNPRFQREDWRGAAKFLDSIPLDRTIILFEDNHIPSPYAYYKTNLDNSFAGLKKVQASSPEDINNVDLLANGKNKIYLFEYLVEITDPGRLLEEKIINSGWHKSTIYNFNGVGFVTLYEIQ